MPLRDILKFTAFLAILGLLYWQLLGVHPFLRWSVLVYAGAWSVCMVDRRLALFGDGKEPGPLTIATIALPFGSVALFVGLPQLLYSVGYLQESQFSWSMVLVSVVIGLLIAAVHWIPFLAYLAIDLAYDRLRPRHTA